MDKINLESEVFRNLRTNFDELLTETLDNMCNRGADTAKMTLTIDIGLTDATVGGGDCPRREIKIPDIRHKVASVIQLKNDLSGKALGVGWELVYNEDDGLFYTVRSAERDGQLSVFQIEAGEDE